MGFVLYFYGFFVAFDECGESFYGSLEVTPDRAFPDGCHAVTHQREFPTGLDISHDVVRELVVPKGAVALRAACHFAAVLVPKATVYKNNHIVF